MTDQTKTESSCHEDASSATWYPLRKWWQPSRLFIQDFGLPLFLEPGDPWWADWVQRRLAGCSWPGYVPSPVLTSYVSVSGTAYPSAQISKEQHKWRVSLDVAHFSPAEISISTRDGFLEVGGKHEDRPDEHGFIARCFTRKYRLPIGINVAKITSTLSGDGILSVEAPLPDSYIPTDIIIPIQLERETTEEKAEEHNTEENTDKDPETQDPKPSAPTAPEDPDSPATEAAAEAPDTGDESPSGVHGAEEGPGSSAAGLQQQHEEEEGREEMEQTYQEPAGQPDAGDEFPPGVHGAEGGPGSSAAGLQKQHEEEEEGREQMEQPYQEPAGEPEPLEQSEAPDSTVSHNTAEPDQEEHKSLAPHGETQDLTQPEEPELGEGPPNEGLGQELEVPTMEQDHIK